MVIEAFGHVLVVICTDIKVYCPYAVFWAIAKPLLQFLIAIPEEVWQMALEQHDPYLQSPTNFQLLHGAEHWIMHVAGWLDKRGQNCQDPSRHHAAVPEPFGLEPLQQQAEAAQCSAGKVRHRVVHAGTLPFKGCAAVASTVSI